MSTIQSYSIDFNAAMTAFENASDTVIMHYEQESIKIDALVDGVTPVETVNAAKTLYTAVYKNPIDATDYINVTVNGTALNKILGKTQDLDLATGTVSITSVACSYQKDDISLLLTTSGSGVVMNFDTGQMTGNLTGMNFHSPWMEVVAAGTVNFSANTVTDVFAINAVFSKVSFKLPQNPLTLLDDYEVILKGAVNYSQNSAGLFTFNGSLTEAQVLTPTFDLVYKGNLTCTGTTDGIPTLTGEVTSISLSSSDGAMMLSGDINFTDGKLSGTITDVKFDSSEQHLAALGVDVNLLTLFNEDGTTKDYNADGSINLNDLTSFIIDKTNPGMKIYNWSDLSAGSLSFNPTKDQIFIDDPAMTWSSMTKWTWENSFQDFVLADATKQVTFLGLSPEEVAANTVIFASGGRLLMGDMLATTLNDDNANLIHGSEFDDVIMGRGGNDTLYGSAGNDRIFGNSGNDIVNGETGTDMAMYSGSLTDPVYATLQAVWYNGTYYSNGYGTQQGGIDTFISIENLRGSGGDDTLIGNGGSNYLNGYLGNDTLQGYDGNDTLYGDAGNDYLDGGLGFDTATYNMASSAVSVNLNITGAQNTLGAGNDTLVAIEGIGGSNFNDTLIGNSEGNYLNGNAGLDTMIGGTGNDTYVVDNAGDKTTETSTLTAEFDTVNSSITWTLGANIEKLVLTGAAAINGAGNGLNNVLIGNEAANILNGGAGNDYLNGGLGNDTAAYNTATSAVSVNLNSTAAQNTLGAGSDTLIGIENLLGSNFNDTLTGNSAANILNGGVGLDTMIGGTGNDTYYVDNAGDVTTETSVLATEIDTVVSTVSRTLLANLENLTLTGTTGINGTGNTLNNTLLGNAAANILSGAAGNDVLIGGIGADTMIGGAGNDIYYVDNLGDVTTETSTLATEVDTVVSSVTRTLGLNLEKLTLTGTTAINGTGNALNNTLIGNDAANILNGAAGNDYLDGRLGIDSADYITATSAVAVNLNVTTVQNTLGAGSDTLIGIENLLGSNFNDTLTGNAAANVLNGGIGNDNLNGGAGSDTLNGGAGIDTMLGGTGNDTYYVDNAGDVTTETSTLATEIDTVVSTVSRTLLANLENLTLAGTAAINGTGNLLNNTLVGNAAANILSGAAGNDVLIGGIGADTMIGGTGNDIYYVDNLGDVTTETSTLAIEVDTVVSSVTRTLGLNLEKLTLTGTTAINGTGNTLNNTLVGNAAANILSGAAGIDVLIGAAGNDVLFGGLGNDTLVGGAGLDTFVFDSPLNAITNKDSITDFIAVDDTVRLDQTVFTKLATLGTLSAGSFRASTTGTAADSNDYVLYNTTTGALLYDADGSGAGLATQFATLTTKPNITAADFVVVA